MRFRIHTIYEKGDMKPIIVSNVWMKTKKRKWENALADLNSQRFRELCGQGVKSVEAKMSTRSPWHTAPDFLYFEFVKGGKHVREKWARIR